MSTNVGPYYEEIPCQWLGFKSSSDSQNKQSQEETTEVDEILVKGMKHLSFDELQREQEDLHGVSETISKHPEEIERKLAEMDHQLQYLKPGTAYETAEMMDKDFVSNWAFRMHFLVANRYNPNASADQMIRYFKVKSRLFPPEKLAKEITLEDLDEDDLQSLLSGSYQISRIKDRSNRTLLLQFPGLRSFKTLNNELRARYYIHKQLIKSLDPNRGVVVVSYAVGRFRDSMMGSGLIENTIMGMAMPFHTAGIHICMDSNKKEAIVAKAAIAVCSANMKAKLKIHTGSHLECQYLLSTFGIPREALPMSYVSNDAILEHQKSWYQECLYREQGSRIARDATTSPIQPIPNKNDVLYLGKTVNNAGNEYLRALVANHTERYHAASSKDKRILVDLVMESIPKNGGRFLKSSTGGVVWSEVPPPEVRIKISQMFRNQRRLRVSVQKMTPSDEEGPIVETFVENDVLFGRHYEHYGNRQLRQLVEQKAAEYNLANRGRKKEIADWIVGRVKQNGGRFLKPTADNGGWIEVSDKVAETKVSSHFRNFRRKASHNDDN